MPRLLVAEIVRTSALADLQIDRLLHVGRRRGRTRTSAAVPCAARRCRRAAPRHSAADRRSTGVRAPSHGRPADPGLMRSDACAGSNPSCRSRWNTSVQRLFRSTGRLFSSSPQPGQKSSLVTKSLGSLPGSFFFVPASALAAMMSFSSLISLRSNITSSSNALEFVGELLRLRRAAAAFDHLLPFRQVRIEARRLRQELEPAIEQLVVELLGVDDFRDVFLRLAQHFPRGGHVLRRLQRERLPELRRIRSRVNSSSSFSFFSICLSCSVYSSTTLFGTSGYSWYEVLRKTPARE